MNQTDAMSRPRLAEHSDYLKTRYFGALDGLRCLSIVWVIGFHCKLDHTLLFRRGDYGVGLFFVISGFLITTLLLREKAGKGEISLTNFYVRRTLRIFPLYYAAVILYTSLVLAMEHGPERWAYFSHLPFFVTYTGNWFVDRFAAERVIFAFSWSLATEEQFYLLWPSVLRFTRSARTPVVVVIATLILSLIALGLNIAGLLPFGDTGNRIITSIAPTICAGCLLAYAFNSRIWFDRLRTALGAVWSAPLALISMAVIYLGLMYAPAESTREYSLDCLFTLSLLTVVATCCMREDNGVAKLLANPVVRYVGTISYGMYLLHMLAMNATKKIVHAHDWRFFAVAMVISIGLASASYWLYERQFLKLKGRFGNRVKSESVKIGLQTVAS